jgi:hypothetical protein
MSSRPDVCKPVKLPFEIPCHLIKVICDQWDLYAFAVPVCNRNPKFSERMPAIVEYLRAQARRICPATGEMASLEKNPQAALPVEGSPDGLLALLFFCCDARPSTLFDPIRDVIEPVLWAWERRVASGDLADAPEVAAVAADA